MSLARFGSVWVGLARLARFGSFLLLACTLSSSFNPTFIITLSNPAKSQKKVDSRCKSVFLLPVIILLVFRILSD